MMRENAYAKVPYHNVRLYDGCGLFTAVKNKLVYVHTKNGKDRASLCNLFRLKISLQNNRK